MRLRFAYLEELLEHWGPKNFTYQQEQKVGARVEGEVVTAFNATEWLKKYWRSRKHFKNLKKGR